MSERATDGGRTVVRDEIRSALRRTLAWQLSLRDARGAIVCPEHHVEHTGKSAYAAVLALALERMDESSGGELFEVALGQGRRMLANLQREGTSPCHTFRPGRHDPFNCSNAVIDGGACSDALAELVRAAGPRLETREREALRDASLLHARTYLRYAVLDKGIPAQRAWGLTGLAAASELAPDDAELERAALEAVGVLEAIQHPDGSYPYHPLEWGAEHAGASDVSAFYQSRVTAFLIHALERLGRAPTDALFAGPIVRGLEFLCALQGPNGIKCGLVEAKPWYWGAPHEVASHPFDVYALARGHELFGAPRYALAAVRAFRAWARHLEPSGRPRSHLDGPGRGRSYQCPLFWAAHAAWIARAAEALERAWRAQPEADFEDPRGRSLEIGVTWFPQAQLARLEDRRIVAWVRGARPGSNVHHGSPHGAGLLQVARKEDGAELLERCRLGGAQEGEWSARAGGAAPGRGWRAGKDELRFSLWLARVHARAGRWLAALQQPARTLRRGVLAFASPTVSSAFDLAPEVVVLSDGVLVRGHLAWRGGSPVEGSAVERRYVLDGEALEVTDRLLSAGAAREVSYRIPHAASDASGANGEWTYRLR